MSSLLTSTLASVLQPGFALTAGSVLNSTDPAKYRNQNAANGAFAQALADLDAQFGPAFQAGAQLNPGLVGSLLAGSEASIASAASPILSSAAASPNLGNLFQDAGFGNILNNANSLQSFVAGLLSGGQGAPEGAAAPQAQGDGNLLSQFTALFGGRAPDIGTDLNAADGDEPVASVASNEGNVSLNASASADRLFGGILESDIGSSFPPLAALAAMFGPPPQAYGPPPPPLFELSPAELGFVEAEVNQTRFLESLYGNRIENDRAYLVSNPFAGGGRYADPFAGGGVPQLSPFGSIIGVGNGPAQDPFSLAFGAGYNHRNPYLQQGPLTLADLSTQRQSDGITRAFITAGLQTLSQTPKTLLGFSATPDTIRSPFSGTYQLNPAGLALFKNFNPVDAARLGSAFTLLG